MARSQVIVSFSDGDGEPATQSFYFEELIDDAATDTTVADLLTVLEGVSAAKVTAVTATAVDLTSFGTVEAGDYATVADKLRVYGKSASGAEVECSVPCPNETLFGADGELAAGAEWDTFKAVLNANWIAPDGSAVTVISGERDRTTRKK